MNSSFDASIPVLTEILHAAGNVDVKPDLEAELQVAPEAALEIQAGNGDNAAAAASEAMPDPLAHQNMFEQQLSERIFQQLQQRITIALEQRMADVLHHALLGLEQEIRAGLQLNIEHIVAQELARLKADIGQG